MTLAAVKEKLHRYIDQADAQKANAMLNILESELADKNYVIDEEAMQMLNERWENYMSGKSKTSSANESMRRLKANRISRVGSHTL